VRYYAIVINAGVTTNASNIINGAASLAGLSSTAVANAIPASIQAISAAASNPFGAQWCSVVNGVNDPGALNIEFDIEYTAGSSNGSVKIYGIPQSVISESTYLTGMGIQLFGGFTEGLPLANDQVPHQGLLASGTIYPAFGNWTGNELSLECIITNIINGQGGPTDVKNIIHNMPQGTPLSSAIQSALSTAFPNSKFLVNISNSLKLNYPDQGFYQSIEQYQNYVKQLSHDLLGTPKTTGYQGVQMFPTGWGNYLVSDFTNMGYSIPIQFEDLVGQPTWIDVNTIQVKTVLRSDLNAAWNGGNNVSITLPYNIPVTTVSQSAALGFNSPGQGNNNYQHGNALLFSGQWIVNKIRHIGKFRQPTGTDWVTVINAISDTFSQGFPGMQGIAQTGGIQTFIPSGGPPGGIGLQ
jgi:hypothetical protein